MYHCLKAEALALGSHSKLGTSVISLGQRRGERERGIKHPVLPLEIFSSLLLVHVLFLINFRARVGVN